MDIAVLLLLITIHSWLKVLHFQQPDQHKSSTFCTLFHSNWACTGEIIVKRPQPLNRFVALFLVSVCAASLFVGNVRVQADGDNSGPGNGSSAIDKCSPDLLQIADTAGVTRVKSSFNPQTPPPIFWIRWCETLVELFWRRWAS